MTSRSTRSTGRRASSSSAACPPVAVDHLVALTPEAPGEHVAVLLVVVHDQDDAAEWARRGRGRGPAPAA